MKVARLVISVVGALMVLLGAVWIGQGSGYFPYPASSFMISKTPWIYWGLLLAAAGLFVIAVSWRRGK